MNKTAAVVVNWNTRAALAECLRAALNEAERIPLEIVVVDNASADGSADMVAADFPSIKLIRNPVNAGFARAANIALRSIMKRGGVEFLLLLNPDAMVRPGAVEEMVRHLESRPEASACAPALLLPDGKFQAGAGGFLPTSRTAFVHFFFLSRLFPRRRRSLFLHQAAFAGSTEPAEVDWLSGACLLARRQAVEEVGPLDERYFLYAEDIEWCARMKRRGWRLHYLPWVALVHGHGLSSRAIFRGANPRWLDGLFAFTQNDRGRVEAAAVRAFAAAGFLLRAAGYELAGLVGAYGAASAQARAADMIRFFRRSLFLSPPF